MTQWINTIIDICCSCSPLTSQQRAWLSFFHPQSNKKRREASERKPRPKLNAPAPQKEDAPPPPQVQRGPRCVSVCVCYCVIVNSLRSWSRLSVWQDVDRVSVQLSFSPLQDRGGRRRRGLRRPSGQGSVLLSLHHNEGRGQLLSLSVDSCLSDEKHRGRFTDGHVQHVEKMHLQTKTIDDFIQLGLVNRAETWGDTTKKQLWKGFCALELKLFKM